MYLYVLNAKLARVLLAQTGPGDFPAGVPVGWRDRFHLKQLLDRLLDRLLDSLTAPALCQKGTSGPCAGT